MTEKRKKARVWEGELTIPTYLLGPDDQNPPLLIDRINPIHPGSSIIYPYPLQEWLTTEKEDRVWRAVFLQNEYLRLTLLPDLGGHLLSAYDRLAEEEALYRNHVLKYARIGIRGAWVSGGIEWNFPNGHTVTTTSPIDYAIRTNDDGSASVIIGDIERVSRMRWSIALTLYPEHAYFETEVRLFNRTFMPNRFWYWANSAIPASPGLEFISTASKMMTLQDVMNYPVHDGVHIGWDKNHLEPQDLFSLNSSRDFVAWYNHDLDRGMVNYARRTDAPGKKFYTWGNSDDGKIWTELLTDEDGPYAEMQSGRLLTMRIWEIMPPLSVEQWKEAWYPIRGIGSPVYANRNVAVSLERGPKSLRIGIHATSPFHDARISVHSGEHLLWRTTATLDPAVPLIHEFQAKRGDRVYVEIRDGGGMVVCRFSKSMTPESGSDVRGYIKVEPDISASTAEGLWQAGIDYEKIGDVPLAEQQYRAALQRDEGFSSAHRSLGVIGLRRGMLEDALSSFQRALERNPADNGARFFLGSCLTAMERFDEAVEEFMVLSRSAEFGAQSAHMLGGLYLGQGRFEEATDQLQKARRLGPENTDTLSLLAACFRKRGRLDEAAALIGSICRTDPLNFIARAEDWFIETAITEKAVQDTGKADARPPRSGKLQVLRSLLRNEAQSYIELAADYGRFGLYREAEAVLRLFIENGSGTAESTPMVPLYLGYYLGKTGESKESGQLYTRAEAIDPAFVFPHRIESERVLNAALERLPKNGKLLYYLGNLLCSRDRHDEAIALWERASRTERDMSVIHRNLGRSYWQLFRDPDRAIRAYNLALRCDPDDYKLYCELDTIYARLGLYGEREKLIGSIPQKLMENDMIAERAAGFYTDSARYDEALEILLNTHFFPWEFYTEGRSLYEDVTIGRGIAFMERGDFESALSSFEDFLKYPRNIGVGRPLRSRHAEALYRIGLARARLGEEQQARRAWLETVEEQHDEGDILRYYQARALQRLGRGAEAKRWLKSLLKHGETHLAAKSVAESDTLLLLGLAHKGLGNVMAAGACFSRALTLDGSLRRCRWELEGHAGE
jgi:tetratricopeptide (TPR) repeat protein